MSKGGIIDFVINSDVRFAKIVTLPVFRKNEEIAKFVSKLKPGDKVTDTVFNLETGEVYISKDKKLSKYDIYSIPKIIRGEPLKPKKVETKDPREDFLNIENMQKYYNYQHKGDGTYIIYRSDKKPFQEYDEMNISGFIDDLGDIDSNAYQYKYDSDVEDFEEGKRYYTIHPKGKDKKYVIDNFDNFFDLKTVKLEKYFDDYAEHKEAYDMYDPDADIPNELTKKDKSIITKNDIETIKQWLKTQDFGRAEVELMADAGKTKLGNDYFVVSFPL